MNQIDEEQDKLPANELASASSSNSALNAADPEDPNLLAPIVPLAPGGVLLEPNRADPDGLSVDVTYPSMSVHDTIALTFNGENTLVPQDGNGDLKVTFLVPKEYVAKTVGKTVQVFYRVTTNAGAVRSQTLDLDVKLIPLDKLLAPKILQAEGNVLDVGELEIDAVIYVNPWPLIALKQKMWMRLKGSGNLDLPVWQEDETSSIGAQLAAVPQSDLQNLTDGSQLNLVLEVSFDDGLPRQPFPMQTYQIKTAPAYALGALELVGAIGEVIDLGVVSGDPVTVHTHAYIGQTAGDRLLLSWAGVAADGTPITFSREYTVQAGGETGEVQFEVPRANLESLGGGTLQLSYQIIKVDGGIQNSPVTSYSVTAVALVFPAPVIAEASDNTLDPLKALKGANFRVTYPDMRTTDTIVPFWNNISDTIQWMTGNPDSTPPNTVESSVPAAMIGAVIGEKIEVKYQVQRDGQPYYSDVFNLTVGPIPQESLPKPQIPQASGNVLDLNTFAGDADLTVQPWPFIAVGQKIWMRLEGLKNPDLPAWQEYEITSPGTQSTKVRRTDLEGLDDASTLRLVLEVSFDGGLTRKEFPAQNYQIRTYVIENFNHRAPQEILGKFETDDLLFSVHSGPNWHNHITQIGVDGSMAITFQVDETYAASMLFKDRKASYVSFDMTNTSYSSYLYLTCTSSGGGSTQRIYGDPAFKKFEFTEKDISGFTFYMSGHDSGGWTGSITIVLDNIKWMWSKP